MRIIYKRISYSIFLTIFAVSKSFKSCYKRDLSESIIKQFEMKRNFETISYIDASLAKTVDEKLMLSPGFTIDQLMELAGYSVACAVFSYYQNYINVNKMNVSIRSCIPYKPQVLIYCGPGNNGGDGLVAARHLFHFGFNPTIVYPKKGKGILFDNLTKQLFDLKILILESSLEVVANSNTYDIVIDALFGFSFQGPSKEPFTSIINQFVSSEIPIFSIDIPSGWDVNSGDVFNTNFLPNAVISLTTPKICMKSYQGKHYIGGRFVPPTLAEELGIILPNYGFNTNQFIEISDVCKANEDQSGNVTIT